MRDNRQHEICGVTRDSIASELGIVPGDILLAVNGRPVRDVFEYRTELQSDRVELTVQTADGDRLFDIEKDEDEDVGLQFAMPLMDQERTCSNRCVFCFIDQLPRNMRSSLYLKDDDARLSFLSGNYVTLTNLTDEELDRIIAYRFSPLNLSVHTLDPELRVRMLRNPRAGRLADQLRRILEHPITVNAQIVLCPGYNDGAELDRTLAALTGMGPGIASVSVVPVGITRYREENGLPELTPVDAAAARDALRCVTGWQKTLLAERGSRVVFGSDELYLRAGREPPPADEYDGFPQLENGVGMVSLFREEWEAGLKDRTGRSAPQTRRRVIAATGVDFAPLLERWVAPATSRFGIDWVTLPVENRLFGSSVTVTGLLTGKDIAAALAASGLETNPEHDQLLLPSVLLRAQEGRERGGAFLDDGTPEQLSADTGLPVDVCDATAPGLLEWLDGQQRHMERTHS